MPPPRRGASPSRGSGQPRPGGPLRRIVTVTKGAAGGRMLCEEEVRPPRQGWSAEAVAGGRVGGQASWSPRRARNRGARASRGRRGACGEAASDSDVWALSLVTAMADPGPNATRRLRPRGLSNAGRALLLRAAHSSSQRQPKGAQSRTTADRASFVSASSASGHHRILRGVWNSPAVARTAALQNMRRRVTAAGAYAVAGPVGAGCPRGVRATVSMMAAAAT